MKTAFRVNDLKDAPRLDQALKQNATISSIELSFSRLGRVAKDLLEAAIGYHSLKELYLEGVGPNVEDTFLVATVLYNTHHLEMLLLEDNPIHDAGCVMICEAAQTHPGLKWLSLSRIGISCVGAYAVATMLKVNNVLQELRLDINDNIGYDGTVALAESLCINKTLTEFDLSFCNLVDKDAIALSVCLKANAALTSLDIVGNAFTEKGDKALVDALECNHTITKINCIISDKLMRKKMFAICRRNDDLTKK
jgi:Ran GTPase-activating protein (RanGAP) involved in mRNA processing and transport